VETTDLKRALEKGSGRSLDRFFDQWVFQTGHPELEIKTNFERGLLTVSASQKLPEGVAPMQWTFEIEVGLESGKSSRLSKIVDEKQAIHVLSLVDRPKWVAFDPEFRIAVPVTLDCPTDFCLAALTDSKSLRSRVLAAQVLAKRTDIPSVTALQERLNDSDETWMLRAECARCLGKIAVAESLSALVAATASSHPKVRRAVAAALASFRQPRALEALQPLAEGDASYLVKAEACRSLGHTRQPQALAVLEQRLGETSHADIVRAAAFDGLAALREAAALPRVLEGTRYGTPSRGRRAAISALARLGNDRAAREHLEDLLCDRDFFVRTEAARALAKLGDVKASAALLRQLNSEKEGRVVREIREALLALSATGSDQVKLLGDEVRTLQRRIDEITARVERLDSVPSTPIKSKEPRDAQQRIKKRNPRSAKKAPKAASRRNSRTVRSRNK
jgi:aminopeptidase N